MSDSLGTRFAHALARKDADALRALLRPDVSFRAMTPNAFWEADDAGVAIDDILLGRWFEPSDDIDELVAVETAVISNRERVGYRFKVKNADGSYVVEQQAFLEPDGERIGWLRIMCAGFLPEG